MLSGKELIKLITRLWKDMIKRDAKKHWLKNNENAVVASLYYHIRNELASNHPELRIWFSPQFKIDSENIRPDLIITTIPDDSTHDFDSVVQVGIDNMVLAIEVKSRWINNPAIEKDLQRLIKIRDKHDTDVLFVLLGFKERNYESLDKLSREKKEYKGISILYGNEHDMSSWKLLKDGN
jgi:hypothetical protein